MKIYVIGHKPFQLPVSNSILQPLTVGKAEFDIPKGWLRDSLGDSISHKNPTYNELTGLYWIWKNTDDEIVGLCHYRRYFTSLQGKLVNVVFHKQTGFLNAKKIKSILLKSDIILHNKTFFKKNNKYQAITRKKYGSEPNKLTKTEFMICAETVKSLYPEYYQSFKKVMNGKSAHLLNMFITTRKVLNAYCEWLFPLLEEVEKRIEAKIPTGLRDRVIGLLSERLLDVWVLENKLKITECFSINTERVDWKMW